MTDLKSQTCIQCHKPFLARRERMYCTTRCNQIQCDKRRREVA